jgi:hypothetical protein
MRNTSNLALEIIDAVMPKGDQLSLTEDAAINNTRMRPFVQEDNVIFL